MACAPCGIFIGLPEEDLLEIRTLALDAIKAGKTILRYASQGTSVDKEWVMDPKAMLIEANHALHDRDPDTYPAPASRRGRSTNMRYRTTHPL